ncbi:hypothetical protein HA466_0150640 [Hirschfeldia incana]|nr:hypothetical protein HA466_0150640 [Hirschfeldia incana]
MYDSIGFAKNGSMSVVVSGGFFLVMVVRRQVVSHRVLFRIAVWRWLGKLLAPSGSTVISLISDSSWRDGFIFRDVLLKLSFSQAAIVDKRKAKQFQGIRQSLSSPSFMIE